MERRKIQKVEMKVLDEELDRANPFVSVFDGVGKRPPLRARLLARVELPPGAKTDWTRHRNGVMLTMKQVCRLFDVTMMTVYHWVRKRGLPRHVLDTSRNPPVRYDEGEVLAWAAANGRAVVHADYREWR